MDAVWWVPKNDNVIGLSIIEKGKSVVGAVAIQKKDSGAPTCNLFCLHIKILNHPIQGQLFINPTHLESGQSLFQIRFVIDKKKVCTHEAPDTLFSPIFA